MHNIKAIGTVDVGIIGFGAGGLSSLVQMIDWSIQNNQKIKISIFEKNEPSRGLAYGGKFNSHILNLDIHVMSVSHTKPNHFYEWLVSNKNNWCSRYPEVSLSDLFPPRPLFGEYLQDTFLKYLTLAKENNIEVVVHKTEIVDLKFSNGEILLKDKNNSIYHNDNILLALGNFPSDNYLNFKGQADYYHSPFQSIEIKQDSPIVILGTRLTAIDAALRLIEEDKIKNKIYLVSRHGNLPKIIGASKPYNLSFLSKKSISAKINEDGKISLSDLATLFKNEIELAEGNEVDWSKIVNPEYTTLETLDTEINVVENLFIRPWQSVLISFYSLVPWTWNLLSTEDRKIFLSKYFSIWLTYLAAFPLQNAKKIRDLIHSGSIEIIGGLNDISYLQEKYVISFNERENIVTNSLINATGSGHKIQHSVLLRNMKNSNIIKESEIGCIDINTTTSELFLTDSSKKNKIFAIGEPTFGSWFATADLGQVSKQAELAIKELFNK